MEKKEVMLNTFLALENLYGSEVTEDFEKIIPRVVNDDVSVNSYSFESDAWCELVNGDRKFFAIQIDDCLDEIIDIAEGKLITPVRLVVKDDNKFTVAFNPANNSIIVLTLTKPTTELFGCIIREYFKRPDYNEIVKAREEEALAVARAEEAAVSAAIQKMFDEGPEPNLIDAYIDLNQ